MTSLNAITPNRNSGNLVLRIAAALFLFLIFGQAAFGGAYFIATGNEAGLLITIGSFISLFAFAPFVLGLVRFDLFSPLFLFAMSVTLGSALRVPYIVAFLDHNPRAQFLLFGETFENLVSSSLWVLVGVIAYVLGYLFNRKRLDLSRTKLNINYEISEKRLYLVSLLFGGFGAVMGVLFLFKAGIDLSSGLMSASDKASITYETGAGREIVGTGVERFLAKFAEYPFITLAVLFALKKLESRKLALLIICTLAVPVLLVPFLYSSRSGVIMSLLSITVALYYFGLVKAKHLMISFGVVLLIVHVMGSIRYENRSGTQTEHGVVDAFIGSGNGLDLIRTSGIIRRVPLHTDYLYGETYLYTFAVVVPRSVWPEKPETGLGPFIKSEVFGARVVDKNGWPSGMIGEAYLNFGHAGIVLVMWLFGWISALVYNSFRPFLGVSMGLTFLYAFVIWRFGFGMPGLNVAHAAGQLLTILVPSIIFLLLIRKKRAIKLRRYRKQELFYPQT